MSLSVNGLARNSCGEARGTDLTTSTANWKALADSFGGAHNNPKHLITSSLDSCGVGGQGKPTQKLIPQCGKGVPL